MPKVSFFEDITNHPHFHLNSFAKTISLTTLCSFSSSFANTYLIGLSSEYIFLFQKSINQHEFLASGYLKLDSNLRFERIMRKHQGKEKPAQLIGFKIQKKKLQNTQVISIYIELTKQAWMWVNSLAKKLSELGFHDNFKMIRILGRGSSAVVLEVKRLRDEEVFAAKAISKEYLQLKEERKMNLSNEIRMLRLLDSKNILKFEGVFETKNTVYIVTQLLKGRNLYEQINVNQGFSLDQTKIIMRQLLQGLAYMHGLGVMHRDLKLENIVFKEKQSYDLVIVDFGLAVFAQKEPNIHYRCGTPGYIAPEIINMKHYERISVACDLFSAGAILHILLTNKYLFEGETNSQIYSNNQSFGFNLSSSRYSQIDRLAMDLLTKMLEIKPEERITAVEALQHLFLREDQNSEVVQLTTIQQSSKEAFEF